MVGGGGQFLCDEKLSRLEILLEKLLTKEEIHWKQRSSNNWLHEGDRNTTYFHNTATDRRRRNTIHQLQTPKNTITTN